MTQTNEQIKEGLRIALRYPKGVEHHATDMDSRSSLDRAVDFILSLHSTEMKEMVEWVKSKEEDWASREHERWSKWQKYMHSKMEPTEHDALMHIGTEWFERWNRQINTPYSELSEREKESDREQVRPYINDILSHLSDNTENK